MRIITLIMFIYNFFTQVYIVQILLKEVNTLIQYI